MHVECLSTYSVLLKTPLSGAMILVNEKRPRFVGEGVSGCVWREAWRVTSPRSGCLRAGSGRGADVCICSVCCCVCMFSNIPVCSRVRVYAVDAVVLVSIHYDILVIDGLIL